ncbi:MAG: hypothetical protein ACI906_002323 [Candidatus Latescibacterota bacterium]|jgi:hypothetical protein
MRENELDSLTDQVRQDGFGILRNHLPRDLMQDCNKAFAPILRDYVAQHDKEPNRGLRRHYIPLPLEPPFYDARIFACTTIHGIVTRLLGPDALYTQFATDTPLRGSVYQAVHSDIWPLFVENPDLPHPPALIAINFSFTDVGLVDGPFQVARGSHRLPKEQALERIKRGEIPLEPLLFEAGDVLIRDPRCLHRGSPNRSDRPRTAAVIGCERPWLRRGKATQQSSISRAVWDGLSELEKKVLARFESFVAD